MMKQVLTTTAICCLTITPSSVNGFTTTSAPLAAASIAARSSRGRTAGADTSLNLFGFGGGPADFKLPFPLESLPPMPEIPSFLGDLPKWLGAGESVGAAGAADCLEECALNDATHAMLDFDYEDIDSKVILKAMKVIGNMVVLQQSVTHLQDVLKDELLFQIGFLGLATWSLVNTVAPKIKTHQAATMMMTPRDRLAFRKLFKPAGFSWLQFRELSIGSDAMEWVTVEAGEVIDEESAFWLYEGDVDIIFCSEDDEDHLCNMEGRSEGSLLGEEHLLSMLHSSFDETAFLQDQEKTYIAGEEGATYLRLDNESLKSRFRHDDDLATSIRRMTYTAMKNKMNAFKNKAAIAAAAHQKAEAAVNA